MNKTFANDEYSEKSLDSIEVTDGGIVNATCVNDEHSEKVLDPIEVTDDGIVICISL